MPLISTWFDCKSCGSTFLCHDIDEFLDHKKEKHLSEFQQTTCIIFQESKNDGLLASATQQLGATLCYQQDEEFTVQLCSREDSQTTGSGSVSGSGSRAEPGPGTGILPPEPPVFYEMYVAAYETQTITDTILNNEFQLEHIISTESVENCGVVYSENNADFILNTFPNGIDEEIIQDVAVNADSGPILKNTNTDITDTCENTIFTPAPPDPTKPKPSSPKKGSLGTSPTPKIRRRKSSKKMLDRHETIHDNAKLKPKSRSQSNKPFFIFPEPQNNQETDSLKTLQEWLLEQKLSEKLKTDSSPTETETNNMNIIRLDPDPTEIGEVGDELIKITPESPIKCKLCSKNLESEAEVKVHVTHCWLENKRRHRHCVPCDKTFDKIKVFRKHHQKFHILGTSGKRSKKDQETMLRRYLCHLCPMRFKTSFHLKRHLERHVPSEERAKPFVCEICGAAFSDNYCFKTHISTVHSEIRPFPCPHFNCHAASKTKKDLNTHLRSHSETKPFSCPKEGCLKSYKTKAVLGTHLKSVRHTGVSTPKSWKCEVQSCKKKYSAKSSLDKHMIVVHGASGDVPRFECDICKKVFPWKVSLLNHGRTHHAL